MVVPAAEEVTATVTQPVGRSSAEMEAALNGSPTAMRLQPMV